MTRPIEVYNGDNERVIDSMVHDIWRTFSRATAVADDEDMEELEESSESVETIPQVPEFPDLIGIDSEVYRQINSALAAGFRHLLFYGPPGTGKTTIAQRVAGTISERWKLITGSADWSSQDIIGGYTPLSGGQLTFMPGILLEHFDKPLVFDELNRCDIDKVIGPLFTVLSGQGTTLPYLTDPSNKDSARIEILPNGHPDPPRVYAPTSKWKLIATINSIDKASLYQMSYALTRRFAWIYVDIPTDLPSFVRQFIGRTLSIEDIPENAEAPLADIWSAVNAVRPVGPAPVIDTIRLIHAKLPSFNFFTGITDENMAQPYLDGFYVFMLPMLDGILQDKGHQLSQSLGEVLRFSEPSSAYRRMTERILGVSV